ncbi:RNA polymerase sigma factor [Microlunatus parietis]|uniref:RNA polymerase sigma factor (Sigma-70 family) n=1 Tax=Microlunatus parietis TaxID=682979 RepID=A0A7Y9LA18_9ACTN|nr:sigma-70 family RNA polymerase sigma factor [Microlunatus parietis]NYE72389.1 RNA polymerase sigma factor (sigma-70 family) [Microlunatus parietis]
MTSPDPKAIEELLRAEAPQVLGALTRRFGRFDIAEDAVQEALLTASRQWPEDGVPDQPRSWLIKIGYRRLVDLLRSEQARHRRESELGAADLAMQEPARAADVVDADDSLQILLLCCHPALTPDSQVALTLRAVGGLTTAEIAHAYGATEATLASRISRAKQQLRQAGARFALPAPEEREQRVAIVLRVLYLIFNEGYTASAGDRLARSELTGEAIRLTRMLHRQLPDDPEIAGLLALMLINESRTEARTGPDGHLVPLEDQDRTRWDRVKINEGTAILNRAWSGRTVGPYQLQAAIAAVHAQAETAADTDWRQIASLYVWLERAQPTAPVRLSRVVAVAQAYGTERGLALLARLEDEHGLSDDRLVRQRVFAVRAHLHERGGATAAAVADYRAAAELTDNTVERDYLIRRAASLAPS